MKGRRERGGEKGSEGREGGRDGENKENRRGVEKGEDDAGGVERNRGKDRRVEEGREGGRKEGK